MGELEKLKGEILKSCGDRLILYEVDGGDLSEISEKSVEFAGGNYKDFLNIAEKLGAKIIYYSESFGEKKEDEIAEIDMGFVSDGILHTFSSLASWYEKEREESSGLDEEKMSEDFDSKSAEELAKELNQYVLKEFPDSTMGDIERLAEAFWESKGFDRYGKIDIKDRMKMDKAKEIMVKRLKDIQRKQEKTELPKLIEDCTNWARENGLILV
jgi:hypothetical protein